MGRKKPVVLASRTFESRLAAAEHFQAMLRRYSPGDRVNDADAKELNSLLNRHPRAADKIGAGIDHFEILAAEYNTQCFCAVRIDSTIERFSYKACVAQK